MLIVLHKLRTKTNPGRVEISMSTEEARILAQIMNIGITTGMFRGQLFTTDEQFVTDLAAELSWGAHFEEAPIT